MFTMILSELTGIAGFVALAIVHVLPFFILSIFLSVLINALELRPAIRRAFGARQGPAILLATLVGAFSPFCSCSVIPIIAGLLASGVPLAPVMSFWIASPTMDPEIFALTVGVLGWPLAIARLLATLALSLGAGFLTLALTQAGLLERILPGRERPRQAACCNSASQSGGFVSPTSLSAPVLAAVGAGSGAGQVDLSLPVFQPQAAASPAWRLALRRSLRRINWKGFGREMLSESRRLGGYMLLAFLLEALISRYVPQELIASTLGRESRAAVPLAALVGVPLYLSNLSALPIVRGLLTQGMQPGAAIAFLIAGAVTTLPAMTAVWGVVRKRVFFLYFGISLVGATLLGWVTNLFL